MLYAMLTGMLPFGQDSDTRHSTLYTDPPFDEEEWARVSNPTKLLVCGLLRREAGKRCSVMLAVTHTAFNTGLVCQPMIRKHETV